MACRTTNATSGIPGVKVGAAQNPVVSIRCVWSLWNTPDERPQESAWPKDAREKTEKVTQKLRDTMKSLEANKVIEKGGRVRDEAHPHGSGPIRA